MSAGNLEAIKAKYHFKDISIATWRDPSLSVHPARGGPSSALDSSDIGYKPRYKVRYPAIEPTDDEDSGQDGSGDTHDEGSTC